MNFYDILLAKKISGGGGGDITTEALNVTANGQYTAPQGKAYTPVNVDIKGYKVGEVDVPTDIASFTASDAPLKSLTASIVPVQAGSGDPSPENVRPISGWTEEVITVTDDLQNPTVTHTTTIPFTDGQGQSHTSYGGQIDVISGKEDDTYGIYQKTNFALPTTKDNKNRWEFGTVLPDVLSDLIGSMTRATTDYDLMCNNMTIKLESSASVGETTCSLYGHSNRVEWRIRISDEYTAEEAQAIANASVIRYPINVVTLQQQPTSIKSLDGENNVSASTGDVEELKYFADL